MNLNKVQLIGRLTRDPEIRTTPSGQTVATIGIATNRTWNERLPISWLKTCKWDHARKVLQDQDQHRWADNHSEPLRHPDRSRSKRQLKNQFRPSTLMRNRTK